MWRAAYWRRIGAVMRVKRPERSESDDVGTARTAPLPTLQRLPLASGWTRHRDLPAPQGATFQAQWKKRDKP